MGGAIFESLLEDSSQGIASWCAMRCTQVYAGLLELKVLPSI